MTTHIGLLDQHTSKLEECFASCILQIGFLHVSCLSSVSSSQGAFVIFLLALCCVAMTAVLYRVS